MPTELHASADIVGVSVIDEVCSCARRHNEGAKALQLTAPDGVLAFAGRRSEEHTSELQSLMRSSYAVFCLKTKNKNKKTNHHTTTRSTRTQYSTLKTKPKLYC